MLAAVRELSERLSATELQTLQDLLHEAAEVVRGAAEGAAEENGGEPKEVAEADREGGGGD